MNIYINLQFENKNYSCNQQYNKKGNNRKRAEHRRNSSKQNNVHSLQKLHPTDFRIEINPLKKFLYKAGKQENSVSSI